MWRPFAAIPQSGQRGIGLPVLELARAVMQKPLEVVLDEPDFPQGLLAQFDLRLQGSRCRNASR